jgi:hypothetical protein
MAEYDPENPADTRDCLVGFYDIMAKGKQLSGQVQEFARDVTNDYIHLIRTDKHIYASGMSV